MPTDKLQALGKLRTVLVATFNKAREHKHRMVLLKTVIKFMHTKIVEWEKEQVKLAEAKAIADEAKAKAEAELAAQIEAERLEATKVAETQASTEKETK